MRGADGSLKQRAKSGSECLDRPGHGGKSGASYAGTGIGLRMLIYSHDTFGLGHLRRCMKISQALKAKYPDLSVLIVTGSPQVHRYNMPPGVDYVKLPAVRKTADEQYEPRNMRTTFERVFNLRSHLILETVKEFLPHILLVDHSPLGMKREMQPALDWIRDEHQETITILGLRDIIDEPEKVIEQWRRQAIYGALERYYDHIFIYGSKAVFDPVEAYKFPEALARKSSFCGYISESDKGARNSNARLKGERKFVLVTIGGGDGAGEAVIGTYIDMLQKFKDEIDFESLIITGPFISEELWKKYKISSRGLPVTIRRFVSQTRPYLLKSDLVISTGGYNTTSEILTFAKRALVIPRIMYRNEQLLRAQKLSDLGLVTLLHPDRNSPDSLYSIIRTHLASEAAPLTRARADRSIDLDGASRLASYCGMLFSNIEGIKEPGE
jgi:predicted glycosyltransferase